MSEREQFEAWATANRIGRLWRDTEPGYEDMYADTHTQMAWRAWRGRVQFAAPFAPDQPLLMAAVNETMGRMADRIKELEAQLAAPASEPVPDLETECSRLRNMLLMADRTYEDQERCIAQLRSVLAIEQQKTAQLAAYTAPVDRDAALEEAAKVIEGEMYDESECFDRSDRTVNLVLYHTAEKVRALKTAPKEKANERCDVLRCAAHALRNGDERPL